MKKFTQFKDNKNGTAEKSSWRFGVGWKIGIIFHNNFEQAKVFNVINEAIVGDCIKIKNMYIFHDIIFIELQICS